MIIAFPAILALVQQCAPGIAPEAILSIVSVESGFDPLAINVNHVGRFRAETTRDAATIASRWISAGYSVDLGLAQINTKNLGWTGLSVESAFNPCANLAAAEKILQLNYSKALREARGVDAISRTFSLYNSGNPVAGFRNNYVARVWRAAGQIVPAIAGTPLQAPVATLADASTPVGETAPLPSSFVVRPGDRSVLIFK